MLAFKNVTFVADGLIPSVNHTLMLDTHFSASTYAR